MPLTATAEVTIHDLEAMPEKRYDWPFGQPKRIEAAQPILEDDLPPIPAQGVTIEVVAPGIGAGYLFHIHQEGTAYNLYSYKGDLVTRFTDMEALLRFINHAAGLKFDMRSWRLSEDLNRRIDIGDDSLPSEAEE